MRGLIIGLLGLGIWVSLVSGGYLMIKPALYAAVVSAAAVMLFALCLRTETRQDMAARALAIAISLPIIAWSLPHLWLLCVILCIWVPIAAGRFEQIVPVYLFSMLLLPGLDDTVSIGSLKLFDFGVHDAMAIGAAVAVFVNPAKGRPGLRLDLAACGVVFLIAAALARDTSFSHFFRSSTNVLLDFGLPYYIVSRGLRSFDELRTGMVWLACGAIIMSALMLFLAWKTWPLYNELYQKYELPTLLLVKMRGGFMRAGGPFVEATSAAMVLVICILALWLSRGHFRSARHHLLLLAVSLVGMAAPQSRGAWLGLILAMTIAEAFRGRYVQLAQKLILASGAAAIFVLAAQFSPYLSETIGLSGGSSDTSDYRRLLLDRGLQEFWHRPILGYSVDELNYVLRDLRQGEGIIDFVNTYIWVMLISGVGGLLIFMGSFLFFLNNAWRYRRAVSEADGSRDVVTFVFAGIAMLMEMLFFTSFGERPAYYLFAMFGFSAALTVAYRKGSAAEAPDQAKVEEPPLGIRGLAVA